MLAYWLWANNQQFAALLLVLVAATSIAFHLHPHNDTLKLIDIITANLAILITVIIYAPYYNERGLNVFDREILIGLIAIGVGLVLFFYSGTDRESSQYVLMHSFWHVLTALSCFLFIREAIQDHIDPSFNSNPT